MMTEHTFQIANERFWYQIDETISKKGGVYILFSKTEDKIVTIDRLLGNDEKGVLYIGMAKNYLDRVIELKKSLSPDHNSFGHECGYRWKQHKGIYTKFPYNTLFIKLIETDDPRKLESELLKRYEKTFGELPPLNRVQ